VATLFYDENGNGLLDPSESVRVPNVMVDVGGKSGRSAEGTGRVAIAGVPTGKQLLAIRPASLPAYYQASAPVRVQVPASAGTSVALGVTLAIGANRPNTYLAFGDSITDGDGSSDDDGYRRPLERRLAQYFGRATVQKDGDGGTDSRAGAARIGRVLRGVRPAYLLILYGTNDWNQDECNSDIASCFTASAIQAMIQAAKANGSLPIVSTIIPVNADFDARAPADRNIRVQQQNAQIRAVCRGEGVPLAESYDAFIRAAAGNLRTLFADHVHPNDRGHDLIAQSFFDAIAGGGAAGARRGR
jgi:lysophospholipase L1-like esterase